MKPRTTMGRALAEIDALAADERRAGGSPLSDAKRAVRLNIQVPGSIAYFEDPLPTETGIAAVFIVAGGGLELRVALGRNRTANLDASKPGSAMQAMARDAALSCSLALQHGTPLDTLRNAQTRNDAGESAGPLGRLLDLIETPATGQEGTAA